jgi:sulfatase modifying factor 1
MGPRRGIAFRFARAGALAVGLAGIGVASVRAAGVERGAVQGQPPVPREELATAPPEVLGAAPIAACADEMTLVEGAFCPRVEQKCLRWMDPPGRFHDYRCAEYAAPARCLAPRVHRRFCIDTHERSEAGTDLPLNQQSWTDAKRICEAAGARVCEDSEWTFACEGEEMRPYPYGWTRAASRCNADHVDLLTPSTPGHSGRLRDEREPVGAHPDCASPFGVLDMAGNVAEWVSVDGFREGSVVVQKGNWWQPGKHACRDEQAGHDRHYKGTETGFRCCAPAAAPVDPRMAKGPTER